MALRVIFWNVYCLPSVGTFDKIHSDERANAIIPHIKEYDVVILNEAWTDAVNQI